MQQSDWSIQESLEPASVILRSSVCVCVCVGQSSHCFFLSVFLINSLVMNWLFSFEAISRRLISGLVTLSRRPIGGLLLVSLAV